MAPAKTIIAGNITMIFSNENREYIQAAKSDLNYQIIPVQAQELMS